jgi:hypothetical protein
VLVTAILLVLAFVGRVNAQVATAYGFTQNSGTFTLNTSSGTVLWNNGLFGTFDDNVSAAITIPSFTFNGTAYTTMFVSSNGFITFGTAPTTTNLTPLSSTETYARAVAAFGADLRSAPGVFTANSDVRWFTAGSEVVVQWRNVRRYATSTNISERFSFQIRLNTSNGRIVCVYSGITSLNAVVTDQPEVGLRGPNNTFATNVNNRTVTTANNWATSADGTAAASKCRFTATAPATNFANGLTYTWIPCSAPAATFTVVENCAGQTFSVNANVSALGGGATATLSYSLNGGSPTDVSIGSLGVTTVGPFPVTGIVSLTLSSAFSNCGSISATALSACPVDLVCGNTLNASHCYGNNDNRTFTYTAPSPETVTITFIGGTIDLNDIIRIYDGTDNSGALLATSTVSNLAGLTATSQGQSLFMEIDTDPSNSCATGQQASWDFEVKCTPACVSPDGSVTVITDCNSLSYSLDVEVLFSGDAPTTNLWYSVNGGPATTVPGLVDFDVQTIGPFALTSVVNVRLLHADQAICDRNLGNFTRNQLCPPANDLCGTATTLGVNTAAQCPSAGTIGSTLDAGSELPSPECAGSGTLADVWYRFNTGYNNSPIRVNLSALTAGSYGAAIYSSCGGSPISCSANNPAFVDLVNASAYTDYWVRVFTNTSIGAAGTFRICISATPTPSACGQVARDPGGTGNYGNNQNVTTTYCPTTAGQALIMSFTQFNTEANFDFVRVYNGPSTSSPLLGTFSGTTIPGPFTSTHPTGCLTVNFTSDGSQNASGFEANLTCCVAPAPTLSLTNNGPVCAGSNLQLNCNAGSVFSWTGPNGFTSSAQNPSISNATTAATGTYTVTARNGANGCPTSATTSAVVNAVPATVSISPAAPAAICAGNSVQLTASGGTTAGQVTSGGTGSTTVGNTTASTLGPNPMQNYYGGTKQQMVWRASELSSLGLTAGSQINSIAVDLAAANPGYGLTNFRIKTQWSSSINAVTTTPVSTGWTTVFPAQTVTPQVGFNTFTFSSPITWNGTDNLLVEFNYSNNNAGVTGTYNTANYATGLSFNATSFYRADNATVTAINGYAMTMTAVYSARNHTRFSITRPAVWTWSPATGLTSTTAGQVNAGPATTTTYTAASTSAAGCTRTASVTVSVNPLPVVTCPTNSSVCVSAPAFALSGGSPAGGTYSGTGVSAGNFNPAVAGVGPRTITYTFTNGNGCTNSCTFQITVNPLPVVSAGSYGPVCINGAAITLGGTPVGGTWSGTGVSGNSFNPAVGTQTITYTFTNGNGCTNSATTTVTVNPLPVVSAGSYGPVCIDAADITLSGTPSGGTWSGTGVSGNSFDPSVGTQTITYTFTNGNGCTNSAATTVTVNPLPVVSAGSYGPVCIDAADITLSGTPSGGSWSGTGVSGTNFDPGVGTQTITYTFTNGNGCTNSATTTVTVNPLPVVSAGSYGPLCINGAAITLGGTPAGGTWSGTGVTGNSFDPGVGTQTLTYTYSDGNGCTSSATTTVTVNEAPVVIAGSYGPVCIDAADITLSGTPSGGSWSGTGVSGTNFDPGVGTQTLTYTFTDGNGCTNSATTTVTVNPLPVVSAGSYGPLCIDGAAVTLGGTPEGGTWSGTGVSGNSFDPSVGTQTITYTFTNGNGCTNSATTTVTVNPLPVVSAGSYGPLCINGAAITLGGTPAGGTWSGTGVTGNSFDPGVGTQTLTYTYSDGNGCTSSATTTVTVNEAPVVSAGEYSPSPLCVAGSDVTLNLGSPAGGTYAGIGVSGSIGAQVFDPSVGTRTLTYTYADANGCSNTAQTTISVNSADGDNDGTPDCVDSCPTLPFLAPGDACNDGDPNTVLDVVDANCTCAGQACTTQLTLQLSTDVNSFETTWELRSEGTNILVQSGGGWYPPFATLGDQTCLPDGCYVLRVLDAGGDGMTNGGYVLREMTTSQRIIDNTGNFTTGSVSAISGGQGFCLPISNQRVIFTSCDKLDWTNGQYVVANSDPAVSAEWIVGGANSVQDNNSGYEFWIFDPNGSYSFRRFRSHNVSDGFASVGATRACHMKLNGWTAANHVPANKLMNVRVRARVNGVNGAFGPACRLMIDPVRANCPLTKLMDIPGNQYFSCGATRPWGVSNSIISAVPVSGANRYQFRFRLPAEGFEVVIERTTYTLQLNWAATTGLPLQNGKTYDVDVRASKNGGATWCTNDATWGDVCLLTISNIIVNPTSLTEGTQEAQPGGLLLFPNPNRGDLITFSLSAVEEGVNTVAMDVHDLTGKRVMTRVIPVAGGNVNTTIDLNGELAAGMYMVNIIAGTKAYTERLMIQP